MSLCMSVYMCFVVTYWEMADLLDLVCGVCEFFTFPLVSWVRCGTRLYRFLIFAHLLCRRKIPNFYKTFATCLHSKSVPAWPLCMLKRFAENDFEWRPNVDLIAIFVKPLQILLQPISDWQSISHNEVIALAIYLGPGL